MPRGENLEKVRGDKETLAQRFGVKPFEDNESGVRVWVRGQKKALRRFQQLTPEERGWVIEVGLEMCNFKY